MHLNILYNNIMFMVEFLYSTHYRLAIRATVSQKIYLSVVLLRINYKSSVQYKKPKPSFQTRLHQKYNTKEQRIDNLLRIAKLLTHTTLQTNIHMHRCRTIHTDILVAFYIHIHLINCATIINVSFDKSYDVNTHKVYTTAN